MALETGKIEVVEQPEQTNFPQHAASAATLLNDMVGAKYRIISYVGQQVVKGVNYVFLTEQTTVTAMPERHIAIVKINEFDGNYHIAEIKRVI